MAGHTLNLIKKNPDRKYKIYVMDAAFAWSTRTLVEFGVTSAIIPFTNSRQDYENMPTDICGNKLLIDAHELYLNFDTHAHYIVWDDGMQTGKYTLPRIKALINKRCRSIGLVCNLCTRDKSRSHRRFAASVAAYARARGYEISVVTEPTYRQRPQGGVTMQPFWFEMWLD